MELKGIPIDSPILETMMPDGRPMFGWLNEIVMLRNEIERARDAKEEADQIMAIHHWLTINVSENYHKHRREILLVLDDSDIACQEDFRYNPTKYLKLDKENQNETL